MSFFFFFFVFLFFFVIFLFQAEDGIRYLVRSRGLGDVYKRQDFFKVRWTNLFVIFPCHFTSSDFSFGNHYPGIIVCLLYTSDAADERSSVDLGGRRIIKKKKETVLTISAKKHITNKQRHKVQ